MQLQQRQQSSSTTQSDSLFIFSHYSNEGIFCFDSYSDILLILGGPVDVLKNIIPPSSVGEHRILNTFGTLFRVAT